MQNLLQFGDVVHTRSGGTGRRAGLKIQWYLVPCGFDPLLRDQAFRNAPIPKRLRRQAFAVVPFRPSPHLLQKFTQRPALLTLTEAAHPSVVTLRASVFII